MDFGSFLAHAEAVFKKEIPLEALSFGKTNIFNLGEDEKVEEGIKEVWEDLKNDMERGVPMPFPDTSCVSVVPVKRPGIPPLLILDRVIETPVQKEDRDKLSDVTLPPDASEEMKMAAKRGPLQKLLILRIEESKPVIISWICFFYGVFKSNIMLTALPTEYMGLTYGKAAENPEFVSWCIEECRPILKQITAISHPGNYVVQVKPRLTPKEERRVTTGKMFPTQKMPHYVVVDHDVLVGMSGRGNGVSHASPVPHHRRGHWMRLAERCRMARSSGKDRVWVRPAYVGDTQFSDLRNDYKVMMDFGAKEELAKA